MFKWFFGKSEHTLPAIALAMVEKIPKKYAPSHYEKWITEGKLLKEELSEILGENGILLFPSFPIPTPYHNYPLGTPFNFAYTAILNVMEVPSCQCVIPNTKGGMPLGLQVASNHHNDHLTVAVALNLEKQFGGWKPPPL